MCRRRTQKKSIALRRIRWYLDGSFVSSHCSQHYHCLGTALHVEQFSRTPLTTHQSDTSTNAWCALCGLVRCESIERLVVANKRQWMPARDRQPDTITFVGARIVAHTARTTRGVCDCGVYARKTMFHSLAHRKINTYFSALFHMFVMTFRVQHMRPNVRRDVKFKQRPGNKTKDEEKKNAWNERRRILFCEDASFEWVSVRRIGSWFVHISVRLSFFIGQGIE